MMVLGGEALGVEVGMGGQVACEDVTFAIARGPGDDAARMVVGHAQSWVMGYVSGISETTDEPKIFAGVNEDLISDWLVNDCKRHPEFKVVQIARRFITGRYIANLPRQ